jgi:HPt (histidine-containing phosphotransfer) domain-containing protein
MHNYKYINLEYLELLSEGDVEMTNTIIEMLIKEIPTELDKMEIANANKDWEELFVIAHKMKSTLSYVGNESMISANSQIENSTRHKQNFDIIADKLETLLSLCTKVVDELTTAKHSFTH